MNDLDPCPWPTTPLAVTWRDTRATGDPPLSAPSLGAIPERRHPTSVGCQAALVSGGFWGQARASS